MTTPFRPHTLLVTAAILIKKDNTVLLAQRPEGKTFAGLWEFPGGKVEVPESPEAALVRELNEELGITVQPEKLEPFTFVSEDCATFHLLMALYLVRDWEHAPIGREGQTLAWVPASELGNYPMPKADAPLVPRIQALLG